MGEMQHLNVVRDKTTKASHLVFRHMGMPTPLLSVAMIIKNEAHNLEDCLKSINDARPLVDNIYIYDTGSNDGSQDIATDLGAKVTQGTWHGDFSQARNSALELAHSKWVLFVDADEILTINQQMLRRILKNNLKDSYACSVWIQSEINGVNHFSHMMYRIANKKSAEWRDPLHERLAPKSRKHLSLRQDKIPLAALSIKHRGYDGKAGSRAKLERNILILEKKLSKQETDSLEFSATELNMVLTMGGLGEVRKAAEILFSSSWETHKELQTYGRYVIEVLADNALDARDIEVGKKLMSRLDKIGGSAQLRKFLEAKYVLSTGDPKTAWSLASQIDDLQHTGECIGSRARLLRFRHDCAIEARMNDDALATALLLLTEYCMVREMLPRIFDLWGDQPLDILARIIEDGNPEVAQAVKAITGQTTGRWKDMARYIQEDPR